MGEADHDIFIFPQEMGEADHDIFIFPVNILTGKKRIWKIAWK